MNYRHLLMLNSRVEVGVCLARPHQFLEEGIGFVATKRRALPYFIHQKVCSTPILESGGFRATYW